MPVRGGTQEKQPVAKPSGGNKNSSNAGKNISVDESIGSATYSVSITKNTGLYESLKIHASLTIPYGASDEVIADLSDLMVVARTKVVERLEKDLVDITNVIAS